MVTPKGHADLVELDTCECSTQVQGGLLVCPACDTVYGVLRQSSAFSAQASNKKWAS